MFRQKSFHQTRLPLCLFAIACHPLGSQSSEVTFCPRRALKPVAAAAAGRRGPLGGPAEWGQYCTRAHPHRSHLSSHPPSYCVTRHARSSCRCVVDFSNFSRVFHIFLLLTLAAWSCDNPELLPLAGIGKALIK